jgi:hypothetical protein
VISPSEGYKGWYEIFIYLIRHKSTDFSDVKHADFFFGKSWNNRVFRGESDNGIIGVRTSAFGSFLCVCRVTFHDGVTIELNRYIDFEMSRLFDYPANKRLHRAVGKR